MGDCQPTDWVASQKPVARRHWISGSQAQGRTHRDRKGAAGVGPQGPRPGFSVGTAAPLQAEVPTRPRQQGGAGVGAEGSWESSSTGWPPSLVQHGAPAATRPWPQPSPIPPRGPVLDLGWMRHGLGGPPSRTCVHAEGTRALCDHTTTLALATACVQGGTPLKAWALINPGPRGEQTLAWRGGNSHDVERKPHPTSAQAVDVRTPTTPLPRGRGQLTLRKPMAGGQNQPSLQKHCTNTVYPGYSLKTTPLPDQSW